PLTTSTRPLRSTSAARCARSIHEATEQPPPAKPDHLVYHPIEGGEKGSNGRAVWRNSGAESDGRVTRRRSSCLLGGRLAVVGRLEQVAAGADGADHESERSEPPPQAEHMHVERVATGCAFGPSATSERLSADDRAEPLEQSVRDARLD